MSLHDSFTKRAIFYTATTFSLYCNITIAPHHLFVHQPSKYVTFLSYFCSQILYFYFFIIAFFVTYTGISLQLNFIDIVMAEFLRITMLIY